VIICIGLVTPRPPFEAPPFAPFRACRNGNGFLIRSGISINLCAGGRRNLPLALVKIESRIQFGLADQQFLEPRLVLE
jgi:hypothetical protein